MGTPSSILGSNLPGRRGLEMRMERKTGVSVEDAFWNRLKEIAADGT
jgi:LDH2 family malate/lactate/ureidoglycolate dehydrogenase